MNLLFKKNQIKSKFAIIISKLMKLIINCKKKKMNIKQKFNHKIIS